VLLRMLELLVLFPYGRGQWVLSLCALHVNKIMWHNIQFKYYLSYYNQKCFHLRFDYSAGSGQGQMAGDPGKSMWTDDWPTAGG
jgi:hypothetical protein